MFAKLFYFRLLDPLYDLDPSTHDDLNILPIPMIPMMLNLRPRVVESFTGDIKLGRVGLYTLCSSL